MRSPSIVTLPRQVFNSCSATLKSPVFRVVIEQEKAESDALHFRSSIWGIVRKNLWPDSRIELRGSWIKALFIP